jgi:cell division protein FtsB
VASPLVRRLALGAVLLTVAAYAVQGGEYGTTDLVRQRARRRAVEAEIDTLQREVDSLTWLKKRLDSDPALQERIAREEFGMVRGEKELLYRFADSSAGGADPSDSARRRP